ncbi:MAG: bifunctional phosphoribosylaminoimidazolecarboxamide formyltransferase/IMP cyclohydrolase, partial [Clostridia bacterium]
CLGISEVTGFPEICDGRVKTLHPKVHGGLLARRDDPSHIQALKDNGIEFIDLVCVNLYPFKATIAKPNVELMDAIENIDIGGPSMIRSAAKNFASVTVVCDSNDYKTVIDELKANGDTQYETRFKLSAKAYRHTAAYDATISQFMTEKCGETEAESLTMTFDRDYSLRYGENPHQNAVVYKSEKTSYSVPYAKKLHGKELSYNNLQDANATLNMLREFNSPCVVAVKHMNPCGIALGENVFEAWTKAYNADPVSIFGGIVATNCEVDEKTAVEMSKIFLEIIMAPSFSTEALEVLEKKKNLRLLQIELDGKVNCKKQFVSINGGMLMQDQDTIVENSKDWKVVTAKAPNEKEMSDMEFGMKVCKHVKSNAIVVVKNNTTVGVGAGQMNRIGSCQIAFEQAKNAGVTEGLVLASDAFFPFDDCVKLANEFNIKAIVQPGGSVRDEDSIKACDELGIAMVFTGIRHFKH